eukprot:6191056-Pleurochrysis_carterae.AAC.1
MPSCAQLHGTTQARRLSSEIKSELVRSCNLYFVHKHASNCAFRKDEQTPANAHQAFSDGQNPNRGSQPVGRSRFYGLEIRDGLRMSAEISVRETAPNLRANLAGSGQSTNAQNEGANGGVSVVWYVSTRRNNKLEVIPTATYVKRALLPHS